MTFIMHIIKCKTYYKKCFATSLTCGHCHVGLKMHDRPEESDHVTLIRHTGQSLLV